MDFTKGVFLFYFLPFFLVLHFVTPKKFRKIVDVLASIIFYAWGAGWITFVLLASVCIDFWLTAGIRDNNINKRKYFLLSSILLNVTPFFYYAFYQTTDTYTLVTIGLGFFTLQKIGYSIDVYRNVSKSFVQFIDYCFYILYFPKLISGPFVKLEVFGKQVHDGASPTINEFILGIQRFSFGVAKKVLIANSLAVISHNAFENTGDLSVWYSWIGIVAFVLQVFFDFTGYTDMAIGLGKMTGYKLPENFKNPLLSTSVTAFFKSWHITFYDWSRSYIYLPLKGRLPQALLLIGTVVLMSLWHVFSYNFFVLGLYISVLLMFERIGFGAVLDKLGTVISTVYTVFVLLFGWILFRTESLYEFGIYVRNLFGQTTNTFEGILSFKNCFFLLLACVLVILPLLTKLITREDKLGKQYLGKFQLVISTISIVLLLISVATILNNDYIPFIYSQF